MAGNALTAGLSLRIPDVSRATNSASTYRTYQPSEIIGSTTPQGIDPGPPPPPVDDCGTFKQALVIIVAVVVTVAVTAALGPAGTGMMSSWAAGAIGAAAGSVASQGVAMAVGLQDSFSWKSVGLAALGGAIGGAINANTSAFKSFESAAGVARAITSNVLTQGIGVMTGLQEKFSWQSVAISGAAAAISPSIQKGFSESAFAKDFLGGAASLATKTAANFLTGATTQIIRMAVYGQGKLDFASLAADAFGNALGEDIAERMKPADPLGDLIKANEKKWAAIAVGVEPSAPRDDAPRVNGLTFSEDAAKRGAEIQGVNSPEWKSAIAKLDAEEQARALAALEERNRQSELYGLELKRQARAQQGIDQSDEIMARRARELIGIATAEPSPFLDPFSNPSAAHASTRKGLLRAYVRWTIEAELASLPSSEQATRRAAATAATIELADASIQLALSRSSTSLAARELLIDFAGDSPRVRKVFGPNSTQVRELFSGGVSFYYERETREAIEYMAIVKYNGYIPDGSTLTKYRHSDAGVRFFSQGMIDGIQIGDTIGTFSTGLHAAVKDGVIYFSAGNRMTLESFAIQNQLGHSLVVSPINGRFSPTEQVFQWTRQVPKEYRKK